MSRLLPPQYILPARMTMNPTVQPQFCLSTLRFPFATALNTFVAHLKEVYHHQTQARLPYKYLPPYRQLNDAILALAPGLIHAFENIGEDEGHKRMFAFSRPLYDPSGSLVGYTALPSIVQLRDLIQVWLELWSETEILRGLIAADGGEAWATLHQALDNPESSWEHGISASALLSDLKAHSGLAYVGIPALLTATLHGKTTPVDGAEQPYTIRWRRAHEEGKQGLYLVSQPFQQGNDFFSFRLSFSVQTQAGRLYSDGKEKPWIFVHVGIQRYITEHFRRDTNRRPRALSALVGYNRESFAITTPPASGLWEEDSTLLRLGIENPKQQPRWAHGVAELLDRYGGRVLKPARELLDEPMRYGNYGEPVSPRRDEYYLVYAEGRKFGDTSTRGRNHEVKTGLSLRERSQLVRGILIGLEGLLVSDNPLELDLPFPSKVPFGLRKHDYISEARVNKTPFRSATEKAFQRVLAQTGRTKVQVAILHQSPEFLVEVLPIIRAALLLEEGEDSPQIVLTPHLVTPTLHLPLDPGPLDPETRFKAQSERGTFDKQWKVQMRHSYAQKREEWRTLLQKVAWDPNSLRLALIESTGKDAKRGDQAIKGAIRDACHREGVNSQLLVGGFSPDRELTAGEMGRIKNAVLDLLLRQQGMTYGSPSQSYEIAGLSPELARQLDVIAFCRLQKTSPHDVHYALAVRLRAEGQVEVLFPENTEKWIPYTEAARIIGTLFSNARSYQGREGEKGASNALRLQYGTLVNFVEATLLKHTQRPTIAVIEAQVWRNSRGKDEMQKCWVQLQNKTLFAHHDSLFFPNDHSYSRSNPRLQNLLAVIRLRLDEETPQYITNTAHWNSENEMRDVVHLTSYVDKSIAELLHYFSVAGISEMQKGQDSKPVRESYKLDPKTERQNVAFKHAQLLELVPFYVRGDFQTEEGLRQLCRGIHLLRVSPSFTSGEILQPYPMHLGEALIKDQLCIIGAD